MLVILTTSVFAPGAGDLTLLSIANHALNGRHRLIVADENHADYIEWISSLSKRLREEWDFVLESSFEREALEPARYEIQVEFRQLSDWTASPPRLSVADAERFLNAPFSIVLEDGVSDKAFLLKFATPQQRLYLEEKERRGELSFVNGGGISSMPRFLNPGVAAPVGFAMQRWFMFDSDALQPGQPSGQSEVLRSACVASGVKHHQLGRRSIESYIPIPALESWTYANGRSQRLTREPVMRAFAKLSANQRHYFNMKSGFGGDVGRHGLDAGELYEDLHPDDARNLNSGFGVLVATLFATEIINEDMLHKDGSLAEMRPVINSVVAQVR